MRRAADTAGRWLTMWIWWTLLQCDMSIWTMARSIRVNVQTKPPDFDPSDYRRRHHRESSVLLCIGYC